MAFLMTEKAFLQAIENNETKLTNQELAAELGISERYFYKLKKRLKNKITDISTDIAKCNAIRNIHNLQRNADNGDTTAATRLLEMAEVYIPKKQLDAAPRVREGIQRLLLPEKKKVLDPLFKQVTRKGAKTLSISEVNELMPGTVRVKTEESLYRQKVIILLGTTFYVPQDLLQAIELNEITDKELAEYKIFRA